MSYSGARMISEQLGKISRQEKRASKNIQGSTGLRFKFPQRSREG